MAVVKDLGGLVKILRDKASEEDGRAIGTLTKKEAIQIINTTHGVPYPPGMNSESVLDLFVKAGWITEYYGNKEKSYQLAGRLAD